MLEMARRGLVAGDDDDRTCKEKENQSTGREARERRSTC